MTEAGNGLNPPLNLHLIWTLHDRDVGGFEPPPPFMTEVWNGLGHFSLFIWLVTKALWHIL